MGAFSPFHISSSNMDFINDRIILPTINGLRKERNPFVGVLYIGLMILKNDLPQVLEFNCRFGDPETQVSIMFQLSKLVHC